MSVYIFLLHMEDNINNDISHAENVLLAKTNAKRNSFQAWNKKWQKIFKTIVHIMKYVQYIFAVWRQFNRPEVTELPRFSERYSYDSLRPGSAIVLLPCRTLREF